jgi:hypothetical protein
MVVGGAGGVGCGGGEVGSTSGEASGAGVEDAWPRGIICSAESTIKNRVSGGVCGVADALKEERLPARLGGGGSLHVTLLQLARVPEHGRAPEKYHGSRYHFTFRS